MKQQEFINLYINNGSDGKLTPFSTETGFSLVKSYPKDTLYEKDGNKIFIKIGLKNNKIFYSVNMVVPEDNEEESSYILKNGSEYSKKVTNFMSDIDNDEFIFDENNKRIVHVKSKKEITLNNFIDILINNHLSDRLFWKRKFGYLINITLRFLFWLTNDRYDNFKVSIDKYHFIKGEKIVTENEKQIEPFFKYFFISKNILFTLLLVTFPLALFYSKCWSVGEFSASNPTLILLFFLMLFSCEKISVWLVKKIKDFLYPEKDFFNKTEINFIEKLHNLQRQNKFNLKLK